MARRTFIRFQLRKLRSNRFWCYFLTHTFKIKKVWIDFIKRFSRYSKVVKVYTFQTKKPLSIIFTRSWVLVYITLAHGRTYGRTDRHFLKKFYFFLLIKNTYLDYFSNFTHILTKVSIPFFHMEIGMKNKQP